MAILQIAPDTNQKMGARLRQQSHTQPLKIDSPTRTFQVLDSKNSCRGVVAQHPYAAKSSGCCPCRKNIQYFHKSPPGHPSNSGCLKHPHFAVSPQRPPSTWANDDSRCGLTTISTLSGRPVECPGRNIQNCLFAHAPVVLWGREFPRMGHELFVIANACCKDGKGISKKRLEWIAGYFGADLV